MFEVIKSNGLKNGRNVIKSEELQLEGKTKISFEEDDIDGIKIVLNKDENNNVREIKFICSCGQTKSIILDYE
ncbi:MAG: hypothetical protein LDL01_06760 [Ignavibacterium sp.]|uniref:Uncharacterized protein n=1 Tax=Ignavibacterium album TaxID=591197 RepID=A0A7V2ZI56_9BACT|nr:hypothetical protein [Ignavibacterium album]MCA2005484.1 hypothetical protein [Ignavibacterium sp.]MCX8106942.1 hypothetical protein [Ignavibacterium album]